MYQRRHPLPARPWYVRHTPRVTKKGTRCGAETTITTETRPNAQGPCVHGGWESLQKVHHPPGGGTHAGPAMLLLLLKSRRRQTNCSADQQACLFLNPTPPARRAMCAAAASALPSPSVHMSRRVSCPVASGSLSHHAVSSQGIPKKVVTCIHACMQPALARSRRSKKRASAKSPHAHLSRPRTLARSLVPRPLPPPSGSRGCRVAANRDV
jgi:hypothetical protein